jgi:hypothetical protein
MLPNQAELDIAAYTLAATISNLEDFASRLQRADEPTDQELEAFVSSTDPVPERPPLDRDEVAHLMAFATSAVEDATALGEHAQRLLELSRGFYYESLNATTVYERSQANIAAWLREQASRIEGASGDQSRAAQA